MNARHLSTQLRKTQSVTRIFVNPAIKKLCVAKLGRIVLGCPKSALGGDTTSPIAYNANRNPQWLRTTDAAMSSKIVA